MKCPVCGHTCKEYGVKNIIMTGLTHEEYFNAINFGKRFVCRKNRCKHVAFLVVGKEIFIYNPQIYSWERQNFEERVIFT